MRQFVLETRVKKGRLELDNVPFSDETEVKIIVIPKIDLGKMQFSEIRKLTTSIRGKLSDDIESERNQK